MKECFSTIFSNRSTDHSAKWWTMSTNECLTYNILLLFTCLVMYDSFVTLWTITHQTPLSMGFLGKNTGMCAISFSRGSSQPKDWTHMSYIGRQIIYHWATRKAHTTFYCKVIIIWLLIHRTLNFILCVSFLGYSVVISSIKFNEANLKNFISS